MYKDFSPKFVKHFGNVGDQILEAFNKYDSEVKTSAFPSEEHCFKIDDEVLEKLY